MQSLFSDNDIDTIFSEAAKISEAAKAVEKKEATKTTQKKKSTTARKKRRRGQDTALTSHLVYRVLDKTDGKVLIIVGVGNAELTTDRLKEAGHELVLFKANKAGGSVGTPKPYQCILDGRGKLGNFRYFWRPSDTYTKLEVLDESKSVAMFTVEPWPYYPGGLCFALQKVTEETKGLDYTDSIEMGPEYQEELDYLTVLKSQGKKVITRYTRPDEFVRAMASLTGDYPTEEAIAEAAKYISEHVTEWPPSPAEEHVLAYTSWLPKNEEETRDDG